MHQLVEAVSAAKCRSLADTVLHNASGEIARYSYVEDTARSVRHDVDPTTHWLILADAECDPSLRWDDGD